MRIGIRGFLVLLAAGIVAMPITAQAQQVQNFGKGDKVYVISEMKLKPDQRRHFRQFRSKAGYFSYFFVATDEDHSVYVDNNHNLENAKAIGSRVCTDLSKSGKSVCVPYAVSLPRTISPDTTRASGFSESASRALTGKYIRDAKKRKRWAAFSINGAFQWGWATGREDKRSAEEAAIANCESASLQALARAKSSTRSWAKKRGFHKCKVAHVANYD